MGRAPCCEKGKVKKGPWSPEEDAKLKSYIEHHGTGGNWIALPHKIGLKRCGKSCRLRWLNYLRPNIKHGGFSEEEDNIICSLYVSIGSRWSIIAAQLPGRTDNGIKNYWNTRLKKKLQAGGQGKQDMMTMKTHSSLHTYPPNIITNPSSTTSIQHYYSHLNLTNNHHYHHHDDMISFQLQHIPTSIINHPPLLTSSATTDNINTNITNTTSSTNCHDDSPNIFEGDDLSEFVDVKTEQQVLEDAIFDLERIMAMSSTQSPITWGSHITSPDSFFSQTQPIMPQFDSTYFGMQ